jgi:hypothetical protein
MYHSLGTEVVHLTCVPSTQIMLPKNDDYNDNSCPTPSLSGHENGGGKGRRVGERERGKRRREKERGGRFPD